MATILTGLSEEDQKQLKFRALAHIIKNDQEPEEIQISDRAYKRIVAGLDPNAFENANYEKRRGAAAELDDLLRLDHLYHTQDWAKRVAFHANTCGRLNEPMVQSALRFHTQNMTEQVESVLTDDGFLRELADSGFSSAANELATRAQDVEASKFLAANPDFYQSDANVEEIEREMANREYTAENLQLVYKELLAAGELEQDPTQLRRISDVDLNRLAALSANYSDMNDLGDVAVEYVRLRSPKNTQRLFLTAAERNAFLFKNRSLVEEASYQVFKWSAPYYVETPARLARFRELSRDKFPTVSLFAQLWQLIQQEEQSKTQHPESEQPVTVDGLYALSPEDQDQLLADAKHLRARQIRYGY